jgi:hypothetical protein
MRRISYVLAAAAIAITTSGANAQDLQQGGVLVKGHLVNQTYAHDNRNFADGEEARAFQSIGTIHSGTEVYGTLENTTYASRNENVAYGEEALACQSIGSIGEAAPCQEVRRKDFGKKKKF